VIVLDASALLALLHPEAGWEVVAGAAATETATLSAVNYAEVVHKAAQHGLAAEDVDAALEALDVTVSPFGRLDARLAASFYRHCSSLSPRRPGLPGARAEPVEPRIHRRPHVAAVGRGAGSGRPRHPLRESRAASAHDTCSPPSPQIVRKTSENGRC